MRRSIRLTLVFVLTIVMVAMLGMVSYAEDPATLAVGTAQITAASVNVRTGPSTNSSIVGKMTEGTLVPVLDFNPVKGFVKVSFEGTVCYVAQSAITTVPTQPIQITPAPTAPAPAAPVATQKTAETADPTAVIDRVIITEGALNVRTGPSKQHAIVGKVTAGTIVPVIKYNADNGYAQISYEGVVRYAYISGNSTRVATTVAAEPTPESGTYRVTAHMLNVRTGPSTSYKIIGQLVQNETVTVLNGNTDNGFAQILYQGNVCYASIDYLTH